MAYASDLLNQGSVAEQKTEPEHDPFCCFISNEQTLIGHGQNQVLPSTTIDNLQAVIPAFLSSDRNSTGFLMGALPFDRTQPTFLFQPREVFRFLDRRDFTGLDVSSPKNFSLAQNCIVTSCPSIEAYQDSVAKALAIMSGANGEALHKIVLSRSLLVEREDAFDLGSVLEKLSRDRAAITFSMPLPKVKSEQRILAGATPELLLAKSGAQITSHPLAGSAKRHKDPDADEAIWQKLVKSEKDRREHRTVVEAILDALAPYCSELTTPQGTLPMATASMWHLGTRIDGKLKDPATPLMELVGKLHPTPAVCGMPQDTAYRLIDELEGYDRGFYAGAVGWCDAQNDGRWYVSLRCAEISGRQARIYAGAGIVRGSDPKAEADETSAKFQALLHAFGIDESGNVLSERC